MTKTHRPLFLTITKNDITMKKLQRRVIYIMRVKISWERHENKKSLSSAIDANNVGIQLPTASSTPNA